MAILRYSWTWGRSSPITHSNARSELAALANIFNSGTVPGVINGNFGLGAQGVLTDTPTITYAPLAGERFARSLMMPLPVYGHSEHSPGLAIPSTLYSVSPYSQ